MAFFDTNKFVMNSGNTVQSADSWTYVSTDTGALATRLIIDTYNSTNTFGSSLRGRRARGSAAFPSGVATNDVFLQVVGGGYNPTTGNYATAKVSMVFFAAENWTGDSNGTYVTFRTTPTGTAIASERLRIDHNGNVGINNFHPQYKLDVSGSGNFTAIYQQGNSLSAVSVTGSTAISAPNFSGIGTTQVFKSGDFVLISGASSAAGAGEANTASSLGGGISVYNTKAGVDLRLNSISGGTGITATLLAGNTISINSTIKNELYIPFVTNSVTWTNMPAALSFFGGTNTPIQKLNLANYTGVSLRIAKGATAGAAASVLQLRYLGDYNATVANWLDLTSPIVYSFINRTNSFIDSGYYPLVNGSRSGVFVALVGSGNDGTIDPIIGCVTAHFM